MFTVYVLESIVVRKTYVGFTNDIERRIQEHNTGRSPHTRRYLPWLVKYTEAVDTLIEARKRERYLKSAAGRRFLKAKVFNES